LERGAWGVLENGVALEESAIVPILMQHKVRILEGDFDHDGVICIKDMYVIADAFATKLGDEKWNPMADLNRNGKIDIKDIYIVARNFGKKI